VQDVDRDPPQRAVLNVVEGRIVFGDEEEI